MLPKKTLKIIGEKEKMGKGDNKQEEADFLLYSYNTTSHSNSF